MASDGTRHVEIGIVAGIVAGMVAGAVIGALIARQSAGHAVLVESVEQLKERAQQVLGELSESVAHLADGECPPEESAASVSGD